LSRLEELVSDWELEEIRQELEAGEAPDIVAFRHGIPTRAIPRRAKERQNEWSDVEMAFVRDNYPQHGTQSWKGWSFLDRTWHSIGKMAHKLGVTRKRLERPWSESEVSFVRDNYPNHGKGWSGWRTLDRSWAAIRMKASNMGVTRKGTSANEGWRKSNGMFVHAGKVER